MKSFDSIDPKTEIRILKHYLHVISLLQNPEDTTNWTFGTLTEQLNKEYGTHVLVGENTYELAKTEFDFEEIGQVELKGKKQSVGVYKPQIGTTDVSLKNM